MAVSEEAIEIQKGRDAVVATSSKFGDAVSPLLVLVTLAAESLFNAMASSDEIYPPYRRCGVLRAWRVYSADLTGETAVSVADTAIMLLVLGVIRLILLAPNRQSKQELSDMVRLILKARVPSASRAAGPPS